MRYLMTFAYDGTNYKGYQKQPKAKTIQEEIEKVLGKVQGEKKIDIHASGRTDAHVHALAQKAHFDLENEVDCDKLKHSLNSLLPGDIYVKEIEQVPDTFHARYHVKAKEYIYRMNLGEYDPIERNYVYQYNRRLDVVEMERALKYLEGEHDFKSFTKADEEQDDYVRRIVQTSIVRDAKNVNKITISFLGTGFLRYMVRNIVGTLIEIGEKKKKSEDIIEILNAKDRQAAGTTANPEGLYLKDVFY